MIDSKQPDARGEITRQKIIQAAIPMFAKQGYDGVSTRALADAAEVNQPTIQYHFGSKEGLYRAAVMQIAGDLDSHMRFFRDRIDQDLAAADRSPAALRRVLMETLEAFTEFTLTNCGQGASADFVARAEIENEAMLDELAKAVWSNVVEPCARILARLLENPEGPRPILAALALLGTVTTFKKRFLQKTIAEALGWTSIGAPEIAVIQQVVREQTDAFLQAAGHRDTE